MGDRRHGLRQRLYDLDHRALNARWGVLVAPTAWIAYRLGRRFGGDRERRGAYFALGDVGGALFNRGREEGEPLRKRR